MSAATLAVIYWVIKIVGAAFVALAAALGFAHKVDKKRARSTPEFMRCYVPEDGIITAERPAPLMAGRPKEKVAYFGEVASQIKHGDVLTFSGRTLWSYLLRIATFSDVSHCGMVCRDDEGLWIVDSCEGRNFTKRLLADEIKQYPGQWRWHSIRKEFRHNYHRIRAVDYFLEKIANKAKYGWAGIALKFFTVTPILREIAYLTRLDLLPFYRNRPFCSQAVKDAMHRGSLDPVPGRDSQLVVPQEINQSLAINEGVALLP